MDIVRLRTKNYLNFVLPLTLVVLGLLAQLACKSTNKGSMGKAITKGGQGSSHELVVRGAIELPKDPQEYMRWRLFDLHWYLVENDLPFIEYGMEELLKESEGLRGKKTSQVASWIERQLLYTKSMGKEKCSSFALQNIEDLTKNEDVNMPGKELYSYTARLQKSKIDDCHKAFTAFEEQGKIKIPLNPVTVFFDELLPVASPLLSFDDMLKNQRSIRTFIESTKTMTTDNFAVDGYAYGPMNYSYNHNTSLMKTGFTNLTIEEIKLSTVGISYPEYHKLVEDNVVSFHLIFGYKGVPENNNPTKQSEEQYTSGKTIEFLKGHGFQGQAVSKNRTSLVKEHHGLKFEVTISVPSNESDLSKMTNPFPEALSNADVVMYSGHAGYGKNISDSFTDSEQYKKGAYQIIYLKGCDTLAYGLRKVINAKANGPALYNVDLVATVGGGKGFKQNSEMIYEIVKGAGAYYDLINGKRKEGSEELGTQNSWNSIVLKINKTERNHAGDFQVHGADRNCFSLDKAKNRQNQVCSNTRFPVTILEMKKFLNNPANENRVAALRKFVNQPIDGQLSFEEARDYSQEVCLQLRLKDRKTDYWKAFRFDYLGNCIPQRIDYPGEVIVGEGVGAIKGTGEIILLEDGTIANMGTTTHLMYQVANELRWIDLRGKNIPVIGQVFGADIRPHSVVNGEIRTKLENHKGLKIRMGQEIVTLISPSFTLSLSLDLKPSEVSFSGGGIRVGIGGKELQGRNTNIKFKEEACVQKDLPCVSYLGGSQNIASLFGEGGLQFPVEPVPDFIDDVIFTKGQVTRYWGSERYYWLD